MDGIDPDTLLEWLQTGIGDERDLQLMALEQLCMLLLMADNIDRCFESCPPRTFLPALCKIFLDETAPDNVLEVTARAITYYLDVSNECTRRITQVDGAVKAICNRLAAAEMTDRSSKDLAEQCVKLLEHVCQRETLAVYDAGGIHAMLTLVRQHGNHVHKDTMHSAMSVVTRLCGKMEPNDQALPPCAESLGALLAHEDAKVSECALRCFAALTDRFIRKSMDPAELATHSNLVEHLLRTLSAPEAPSASFTSIVLSLLSNLCRGSAVVTQQILSSSHLIPALFAVLTGKDERCVTDGLRLADLLVILLCEGRSSLPKNAAVSDSGVIGSGSVERAHRHLIDAIRQKDTQALVDAIESGTVDVNYTDDVGQTLLNWAAAFGSADMVIFLCDKGADVNKGHKSSSLHYAACFGRPDIVKMLLQRGANPDLRDEDGKTALDKARERNDEDHAQVASILESPSVYMHAPAKKEEPSPSASSLSTAPDLPDRTLATHVLRKLLPVFCEIFQKSLNAGVRRSSLSLLRKSVQHMTADDLRAATLVEGKGGSATQEEARLFAESLVGVLVTVLDQEDDLDGQEQVLLIMMSLLKKDSGVWVHELVRLGVFEKVELMAKEPLTASISSLEPKETAEDANARSSALSRSTSSTPSVAFESDIMERNIPSGGTEERERQQMLNVPVGVGIEDDLSSTQTPPPTLEVLGSGGNDERITQSLTGNGSGKETIQVGTIYRWKEWRIARGLDSLFIWADPMAFEFSFTSNGWFRYLVDGHIYSMYSNGNKDTVSEGDDVKKAFMQRWRRATSTNGLESVPQSVLQMPNANKKLEVPNWELFCARSPELNVRCTKADAELAPVIIKDDQAGFSFESTDKAKHNITAETSLPQEFVTGWALHGGGTKRARFKADLQRRRVQELAWELWECHLKEAKAKPREAFLKMQEAAQSIQESVKATISKQGRIEFVKGIVAALTMVKESVLDESGDDDKRLSTFEMSVSGLVSSLCGLLAVVDSMPNSFLAQYFKEVFGTGPALSALARKMVLVLESLERFPQYLYDTPGGSAFGLQLLSRRVRMKLDHAGGDTEPQKHLLNRTGRVLKSEPLTTVGQLKGFLLKMVAKQWYDRERDTFAFVKQVKSEKSVAFTYTSDFDDQGILYWLGTNGKTSSEWINPASIGVVKVTASDTPKQPFGRPEDILSRDIQPCNCHSSDDKNANFSIDIGCLVSPSAYTLRHSRGYGKSALRNWLFQGSRDKTTWEVLVAHSDDMSLNDPGSTATWPIEDGKGPFRYFRIAQNGKNASGQTYYLSLSGFEIYGKVSDVILTGFKKEEEKEKVRTCSRIPSIGGSSRKERLKSSDEVKTPSTSTDVVSGLAQGANNNRLKSGMTVEQIGKAQNRNRIRSARGRLLGRGSADSDVRGARVTRGPDWSWNDQDGGKQGRVVSGNEGGWVDVQWENGYTNSYRHGADGRYDIQRVGGTAPKGASEMMAAVRERSQNLMAMRRHGENRGEPAAFSGFAGFSPFGARPPKAAKTSATPLSRFRSMANPSQASSSSSTTSQNSGTIGKKSMSTTNLVDERPSGPSVASTGQAASAESLQHQTPSLENLLARSRVFVDRIAESRDETEQGRDTPTGVEEQRSGSSQPELSVSSSQSSVISDVLVTPRDGQATPPGQVGTPSNSLSVSAPDLAAVRQRQLSTDTFEMDKTLEEDGEEDEEETEPEGDHEERDADKNYSYSDLVDTLNNSGDRGLFERIREVMGMEDSLEQLLGVSAGDTSGGAESISAASSDAGAPSAVSRKSSSGGASAIRNKLGNYAEIIKTVMQQMMDSSSAIEGDEMEEDEIFDEEADTNEDDMEDELSSLGVPVESFASVLGGSGQSLKLNWKQISHLVMGDASRLLDPNRRAERQANRQNLRQWDDEFVLKCTFQALIPAFDPRPGRTNVNQTQDVELPSVVSEPSPHSSKSSAPSSSSSPDASIRLFLRGPNVPGVENVTMELADDDFSLFKCVQTLVNNVQWPQKSERNRRIWEPTYTIIYEDASVPTTVEMNKLPTEESKVPETVNQALSVLSLLSRVGLRYPESELSPAVFVSEKITQKLVQELSDPLVVASRSMPDWCERLVYKYPCLFSVETRSMYMQANAFGVSRSIVWLQTRRDAAVERTRGSGNSGGGGGVRRDDAYEYRVGRLKHERIKVTRCEEQLLEQAIRVMRFHADRKAVLEIEYNGEEGTGLGPTLEFYALVAAELQRKALAIWWCDDLDENQLKMEETGLDLGEGKKPPGYYVRRAGGLFPAPLPPNTEERRRASELFRVLGVFLAKVLQDGRLVDIPLSRPLLKLAVHPHVNFRPQTQLNGVLNLDDFEEVHPVKGRFLKELSALAQRKRTIDAEDLDSVAKRRKIESLTLNINGTLCKLEDLALNFTVNPPSTVFEYKEMELIEGGCDMDVTIENVEDYVNKCTDFYLCSGISDQVRAFREGFDHVFPLHSLRSFSPEEVQRLVSGEQCPEWTREDVLNYTEPKLGYTRESDGFLRFVDVMVGLSPSERKQFLQFATGCSSLPPGGLANLHPRLTVVRKVESGDGSYPSVNTCVHYLKLPEYSSADILRERLLTAVNEKGFHLN